MKTEPQPTWSCELAPQRTRPLSPWKPLDSFTLLYWVACFPQALMWHENEFTEKKAHDAAYAGTTRDPIGRVRLPSFTLHFFVATLMLMSVVTAVVASHAWKNWPESVLLAAVLGGIPGAMAAGAMAAVARAPGLKRGIAYALFILIIIASPKGDKGFLFETTVAVGAFISMLLFGMPAGAAFRALAGPPIGICIRIARATTTLLMLVVLAGIVILLWAKAKTNDAIGSLATFLFVWSLLALLVSVRPVAWALAILFVRKRRYRPLCRMIWVPVPGVRQRLQIQLANDWVNALGTVRQILAYSLQFIPAVCAVKAVLVDSPPEVCLLRVERLVQDPYDWELLHYVSTSLWHALAQSALDGCFFLPPRVKRAFKKRFSTELCFATPAQSSCAGFWLWHQRDAVAAAVAFSHVRDLPFGAELANGAQAIAEAEKVTSLPDLVAWKGGTCWIDALAAPYLRPATFAALRKLRSAAVDAAEAVEASSRLGRSTALGRSGSTLQRLIDELPRTCPYPEWPNLQRIAESWRRVVLNAVDEMTQELIRRPVDNPYLGYSGLPVDGASFVGRRDILMKIESLWALETVLPTVFLYGHRRMGKTSILRHLDQLAGPETHLVFLDMQDSAWVENTGEFLLDIADAIYERASDNGFDLTTVAPPSAERFVVLGEARLALNALIESIDPKMSGQRLILAFDEFEYIEAAIEAGRLDRGLPSYLRALSQRYRWLALIFGGLHTLAEMGRDYRSAFWGEAEHVRVGYLAREDSFRLITQPHPNFDLQYTSQLREEIYRLTAGQPYLLQRLCWEVVEKWNERFLREGEATPRVLDVEELKSILDDDLYAGASYYFEGVWNNITGEERAIMLTMAQDEGLWLPATLASLSGCDLTSLHQVLARLVQHDVATEENGGIRFSCELMRRWVARGELHKSTDPGSPR